MKNTISARHIGRTKYISGAQAARIIGVAHSTFSTWRKKGQVIKGLHPRQFGAREFFPVADVKEFAKTHHGAIESPAIVRHSAVAQRVVPPVQLEQSPHRDPADIARIEHLEKIIGDVQAAVTALLMVSR
jgi:hypothetical protein